MADHVNDQVGWNSSIFDLLRNDRNRPPLTTDALVEAVKTTIRKNPMCLRQWERDDYGHRRRRLPIHLAFDSSPPEVARAVINGWPDSAKERTKYWSRGYVRDLPIHCACRRQCTDQQTAAAAARQVIQLAVEVWPESIMERDAQGRLPLHCALLWSTPQTPTAVIKYLASRCPQALKEKDDRGYLPFHYVVERSSMETVQYFVKKFPTSVTVRAKTNDAASALVVAIRAFVDPPTYIGYLVGEWPGALHEPSTEGRTPLQEAVRVRNEPAVEFMLRTWPRPGEAAVQGGRPTPRPSRGSPMGQREAVSTAR